MSRELPIKSSLIGLDATVPLLIKALLLLLLFAISGEPASASKDDAVSSGDMLHPTALESADLLSTEERLWLSRHPRIRIGITVIPPQILHDHDEYKGLSIDYIRLLETKLDFRFELIHYATWNDVINAAKKRQIDMIFAAQTTPERLTYLSFSDAYIELPNMILVRKGRSGGGSLQELGGWHVAVSKGSAVHEYLKANFPDLILVPVQDELSGLLKVSVGEVDAMVVEISRASYYIDKVGILNLRVAGSADFLYRLKFAVRSDWQVLTGILDKALVSITDQERQKINRRWILVGKPGIFQNRYLWIILAIVALSVLAVIAWNLALQRLVNNRTSQLRLELAEREQAKEKILQSEQRLRLHTELSPLGFLEWDEDFCAAEWNAACEKIFGYTREEALGQHAKDLILPAEVHGLVDAIYHDLMNQSGGQHSINENITKDGRTIIVEWFNTTLINKDGKAIGVASVCRDITGLKQAEEERQLHAEFLANMDRINRAIQSTGDLETMMGYVLDEVLDIFDCDRAYLVYPCNPNAATWSVPIESVRPEYPGAGQQGTQPMNENVAWVMRALLDSSHPIQLGSGAESPVPEMLLRQFGIRSNMAMALYTRADEPWQFGIHQCSHDRVWSDQEMRLFEEIGHRLSDSLNSLLIFRDLRESEERFRLVFENSPLPIQEEDYSAVKARLDELIEVSSGDVDFYLEGHPDVVRECASLVHIINVNQASMTLHEARSKEEVLQGLPQIFTPESYDTFRSLLVNLANGKRDILIESVIQTWTGKRRKVNVYISVSPGYEQSLGKVLVSLIDITERKRSEESLRLAASVFASSQEGILISDAENRIIDINPAFTRLTGYTRDDVLGKNPGILSAGHQPPEFYDDMWRSINSRGEWQGEVWNRRKSGEVYAELLSIVAVKDDSGRLQHYVGAFTDISILKEHEAELDHIAHYDMLTSVPNRRLLGDRLEQAIARSQRNGKSLAICYLDLDGFKPINDQFGHEGGDRMLIEIARRLEWISRSDDTVARLGGDEFVLLWNDLTSEADCIRALDRVLATVSEPMELDGVPISVSASIGVTLYPDDDVDADTLLRHADQAMYSAKRYGKNHYQLFDIRLERQIASQYEFLSMVERGLDAEQFVLYYQPKVDCVTGTIYGCEALLRWKDPVLGLVGPSEFLPMIEEDSLAFRIGCWVMDQVVLQAKLWNDNGISIPISMNLFPCHLKSATFINDLRSSIAKHWPDIPQGRLMMEIVESSDLEELEPIEQVINECQSMGIGFSLDDFGTGYSSLVYLRRLSIEELKIDRSFVRDMLNDPDDQAIVEGVIGLGKAFGLRVVAEGVETIEQARHLENLGCSIVQGFGLGRPMPVKSFEEWYKDFMVHGMKRCQ